MADQIRLSLLELIKEHRSTYGLRHQDYAKYQSHCTNKVARLRQSVGLVQTAGKTRKYAKKDVTADKVSSDKHVQLILFDCERAWAHAQSIKQLLQQQQSAAPSQAKHHSHKRLSRASIRSSHLVEILTALGERVSASHLAQAHAYHLVLQGTLAFEQGKNELGVKFLSVGYDLLQLLGQESNSAHEEALANQMMDSIEPMLRFCAYQLAENISTGVGQLAKQKSEVYRQELIPNYQILAQRLKSEGNSIQRETIELNWRGQQIPVRNAELVDSVVKVKKSLASLESDSRVAQTSARFGSRKMANFDKTLLNLSEAENLTRQLVKDSKIANSSSQTDSTRPDHNSINSLQLAHEFFVYQLLSVRTQRDLLLIKEIMTKFSSRETKIFAQEAQFIEKKGYRDEKKAASKVNKLQSKMLPKIVKLFDAILLSLDQMRDLESIQRDGEFSALVETRSQKIRAERCKYLSQAYALVGQFPSALSLNSRAQLYSRQARATANTLDSEQDDEILAGEIDFVGHVILLTKEEFDALDKDLQADQLRFGKLWFSATGGNLGEDVDNLQVQDLHLDDENSAEAPRSKNLKKKKKKIEFYDVAFNYVAGIDTQQIAARAGLSGDVPVEGEGAETASDERVVHAESDMDEEKEETKSHVTPVKKGWGFGLFGR